MLASSVIEEDDRDLFCYGFFLLVTRFFFFLVTVATGFIAGIWFESIIFYAVFMPLRSYAGGAHARTEAVCTILTTLALSVSVFGIKVMELTNSNLIPVLMLISGSLCILLISPLDTKDRPLTNQEKRHYRKICYMLLSVSIMVSISAQILGLSTIYYSVACGVCLEGTLLSIGEIYNLRE